jgi:hypothetical protein
MTSIIKKSSFIPTLLLAATLCLAASFMISASRNDAATMDELAHIPSGYTYVRYLDYHLNPEHPPLVKALAGIPLLFTDVRFPTEHKSWESDVNGQWDAGTEFLYRSGNDADNIIFLARILPILLTLITGAVIFFWARELMGPWWALIPTVLFGLSPTVLAHGHYVTTDIGASLGTVIGIFSYSSFILFPSKKKLIVAGLCFGIAELLKFSNVLLIPLFMLLTGISFLAEVYRNKGNDTYHPAARAWFYARSIFIIFFIGALVIYAVYFLFTFNYPPERQLSDTSKILEGFSIPLLKDINIFFVKNTILRPFGEYILGILMVLQRSGGGNTGYFLGEITNTGWWYYFPVIFFMKETVYELLLVVCGAAAAARNVFSSVKKKMRLKRMAEYIGTHMHEFSMITFVAVYWAWSLNSTLNIGMRHLLPALPLMYILSVNSIKTFIDSRGAARTEKRNRMGIAVAVVFLIGVITQSIMSYPYFLSFFNIFGGGTERGYNIVTDSNYDWGQDLKRLKEWKNKMEESGTPVEKIAIDYFGAGNPDYYFGKDAVEYWSGSMGNPKDKGIEWLVVSINSLTQSFATETNGFHRDPGEHYEWLGDIRDGSASGIAHVPTPDFKAGTSLFIYHL